MEWEKVGGDCNLAVNLDQKLESSLDQKWEQDWELEVDLDLDLGWKQHLELSWEKKIGVGLGT